MRHGIRVKVAGGKYAGRTFYLYPREDFDDGVHSFPFPFTLSLSFPFLFAFIFPFTFPFS